MKVLLLLLLGSKLFKLSRRHSCSQALLHTQWLVSASHSQKVAVGQRRVLTAPNLLPRQQLGSASMKLRSRELSASICVLIQPANVAENKTSWMEEAGWVMKAGTYGKKEWCNWDRGMERSRGKAGNVDSRLLMLALMPQGLSCCRIQIKVLGFLPQTKQYLLQKYKIIYSPEQKQSVWSNKCFFSSLQRRSFMSSRSYQHLSQGFVPA